MKWKDKIEEIKTLLLEGITRKEIAAKYGVSYDSVDSALKRYNLVQYIQNRGSFAMSDLPEDELRQELSKRGYRVEKKELEQTDRKFKVESTMFKGKVKKFAVISCTHIGSKYQQITYLKNFYQYLDNENIHVVLHAGDMVDGIDVYRGHEYELFLHGAEAQKEYVIECYPRLKNGGKTYVIQGNHDYSFVKKSNTNILKDISKEREDIVYEGDYGAYPNLLGLDIYIQHGGGGVSYARSYKLQKNIEQMSPDSKPDIYLLGHYHVSSMLWQYRNVIGIMLPCFQGQTPYLKRKGLYPEVGGLIVEIVSNDYHRKNGIAQFRFKWIPFYVPIKKDY